MGRGFFDTVTTIAGLLVLVALTAVVVSKNANTAALIQNSFTGFSSGLATAEAPVTGTTATPNLSYASETPFTGIND